MRDPFPLPPIRPLEALIRPVADLTGLQTLPLHVHEIAYAFLLYHAIFAWLAPRASAVIAPRYYLSLSLRSQLQWRMKCVSVVQSVLISALSLWVMRNDGERAAMNLEERIWGYTGAAGMVQAFAVGYFLWDSYIMLRYTKVFGLAMLVHGLACSLVFSLGFRPVLNYYGCVFMLYEMSTPLVNIHWFLDKVGLTGTKWQIGNGIALIATFFSVRLFYGAIMSYHMYTDVWTALGLAGDAVTVKLGPDFTGLAEVPALGALANCPLPTWVVLIYLVGHVTLNSLNLYWFVAMIRAIRRRLQSQPVANEVTAASKTSKKE